MSSMQNIENIRHNFHQQMCKNDKSEESNNQMLKKDEKVTDCQISNEISFSKHVRNAMASFWKNFTLGRTQSNRVQKEKYPTPFKFLGLNKERTDIGHVALSVPNLENIEELVADGTIVSSETFNTENEEERTEFIYGGRHDEASTEERDDESYNMNKVDCYPAESLITQLRADQCLMSGWSNGPRMRGDTILRCNPGRRSDLGSVGPKCLSWSGPQSENEAKFDQSLAHLVGRKGGMV
eukprot:GFUD01009507.1.p1 GENE.GFUD01009507.1~~GFUD01009507.1.p1  ORF type:complete len:239 (-),score=62.83 GFUD01009507.1:84-800(-)